VIQELSSFKYFYSDRCLTLTFSMTSVLCRPGNDCHQFH